MIRFRGRSRTGQAGELGLIGLGLSRANINRLVAGELIHIKTEEMGLPPGAILIMFGETEEVLEAELRQAGLIDTETKINIDPKLREEGRFP